MEINLVQGSKEWLDFRLDKITATDISIIAGVNPFCDIRTLYMKKKGRMIELENKAMKRGKELESEALAVSEQNKATLFRPAVFISDENPRWMASLDGISFDGDYILEIKSPGEKNYKIMKIEGPPIYYLYQMLWSMLCANVYKCVFCNYWPNSPVFSEFSIEGLLAQLDVDLEALKQKANYFLECLDKGILPNEKAWANEETQATQIGKTYEKCVLSTVQI